MTNNRELELFLFRFRRQAVEKGHELTRSITSDHSYRAST